MVTKAIAIGLLITLLSGLWVQNTAYAGNKEWATAGKILAGVVGLAAVQQVAKHHRERDYSYSRVYNGTPVRRGRRVYYHTAPRVYRQRKIWVSGRYVTEEVKVWVPGVKEKIWIPARYERQWVDNGYGEGCWEKVLVEEDHWRYQRSPGYFEIHTERRWVPGYWKHI